MRFMLQVRANRDSESGQLPGRELIEAMFKFNEEMANAGVMRSAEGLQPSARGRASCSPAPTVRLSTGRSQTPMN